MGHRPMSTYPRPIPQERITGLVVGPSVASLSGRSRTASSGWQHIAEVLSRALPSNHPQTSFALEKPVFKGSGSGAVVNQAHLEEMGSPRSRA